MNGPEDSSGIFLEEVWEGSYLVLVTGDIEEAREAFSQVVKDNGDRLARGQKPRRVRHVRALYARVQPATEVEQ